MGSCELIGSWIDNTNKCFKGERFIGAGSSLDGRVNGTNSVAASGFQQVLEGVSSALLSFLNMLDYNSHQLCRLER